MSNSSTKKIPKIDERQKGSKTAPLLTSSLLKHHRAAILLFVFALIAAFPYKTSRTVDRYPKASEVSQETVIAPFTFEIPKTEAVLKKEQQAAEGNVSPVYNKELTVIDTIQNKFDKLLSQLKLIGDENQSDSVHIATMAEIDPAFTPEEVNAMVANLKLIKFFRDRILTSSKKGLVSHVPVQSLRKVEEYKDSYDARFKYVMTNSKNIVVQVDTGDVIIPLQSVVVIPVMYSELFNSIDQADPNSSVVTSSLYKIFEKFVKPSLVYNTRETMSRRDDARVKVSSAQRVIPKNVEIVRKHQIVTEAIAENLGALQKAYEEQYSSVVFFRTFITQLTTLLLLFMLSFILIRHLKDLVPRGIDRITFFNVVSLIVAVSFLIIRVGQVIVTTLTPENTTLNATLIYTAIPMVVGSLLAAALFNKETGFIVSILFAVYGGVLGGYDPIIPVGTLISGGIVSGLAASIRYRRDFFKMVLWIGLTNILIGTTMTLVNGEPTMDIFYITIVFAVTNALTTVGLSFFILPFFEQFFHLTTDMTLMELADMNHPLLKRLAIEAPGTYNHSIMVANLAEAAAASIGADALLCRVVSYYHDIGKLKKPHNFIENQYSKKNVHDKISPTMSVRIITGHVREGLELADEYKLPQAIKDVIPQHHGDAPLAFFYHKANEEKGENEEVDIRDYSYAGPKPQTRENAVVMIADSVEAASRTMKSTTLKDIREMVKKIIWGKISHNQLDESGLDLNDLSEMVNGMMPILEGVYHSRIEYPDEEE